MRMRASRIPLVVVLTLVITGAAAPAADAQTPFVPYFGKNQIRFFTFDWKVYKTEHFEIFFYPSIEPHLERIAGYAENAYLHISSELKHDLPERIPIILYKTQSEFQTNNVFVGVPEGVLAFAEPERRRMVLPIDEPPDQLYRLITHELTHVFEFDMIPTGIFGGFPLWVGEGLANYMAGYWNILDLMQVRDAAISDNVPRMSQFEAQPLSGRLPYSIGHAAFEFIEARWGKEGLRQFLFSLRKGAVGSGQSAYSEALKVAPEEFDDMFDRYLKERFKPFRDKERPMDYGRNIAPKPGRTRFMSVMSIEPSPSGDMLAAVMGNSRDYELDIVLLSARDGEVIQNLTEGFDHQNGIEYIATAGGLRGNLVPWLAWAPVGDTLAYFARTGKVKSLMVINVATRRQRQYELHTVDGPESPAFSPDGKRVAFAALQNGITDIFTIELETGVITNVTRDPIADFSPAFSPDGRTLVYSARVASNDKLFRMDLATGEKRQITFGTHDDTAAKFYNDRIIVFTSTAIDPTVTIPPEVARNANIPNIWTLDLATGQLQQHTDTMSGNISPVVLRGSDVLRVAFVSYYKGEERIHVITADRPIATVASTDFGEPAPIIDFTPPVGHTLVPENITKKGFFQNLQLAGRPPIGLGVTSGGNFYGNTEVAFNDLMGDHQISFFAQSVSTYRTFSGTFLSIEKRLQWAIQGFYADQFFYGQNAALYGSFVAPFVDRDLAEAVQSQRGGTLFGIYPFNRYTRVEAHTGYVYLDEHYNDPALQQASQAFQVDQYGNPIFRRGHMLPYGISIIRETTVFREYGPVSGNTFKVSLEGSPPLGNEWLSRQTLEIDMRHYQRLVANGVLAFRLKMHKSWGQNPDFMYFGGNSEMRGFEYLQFAGHKAFFANVELRYPLVEAMLTPFGVFGGLRGVFFFNWGGAGYNNAPFKVWDRSATAIPALIGFHPIFGIPIFTDPIPVDGFRLVDSEASYGIGIQTAVLGFPIHFDWAWKTRFNRLYEDIVYAFPALTLDPSGGLRGSDFYRRAKFQFWIGYDF